MSFVFTHDQMIEEGRALGETALATQRAVIVGGNAQVYSPFDDADRTGVGEYTGKPIVFNYPNMCSDSLVDLGSVRVLARDVLLMYYHGTAAPVKGQANQIQVPTATTRGIRNISIGDVVLLGETLAEVMAVAAGEDVEDEADEVRILVLSRNLTASQREAVAIEVSLCLPIREAEFEDATVADSFVTLPGDISLLTASWAPGGALAPLRVVQASIHIEYTVWNSGYADKVHVVEDENDIRYIAGENVVANDLKKAVSLAFANSGGMPVAYIAVADPNDMESWVAALSKIRGDYGIVPCSSDPAVLAAVEDLVEHRSRAEAGRECVAWFALPTPSTAVIASAENSDDLEAMLAVVTQTEAGPIVEVPAGNARFLALGVRAGDVLRYGDSVYEEFVIADVVNDDAVTVQGDILVSSAPMQIEIWRKLDVDDRAITIANKAAAYQNKRIRAVWANEVSDGSEILEGWHLCAALAGLRSGCAPHRSLTGVQIAGILDADRVKLFDEDQLDMMAECGVWVVDERQGVMATRQGLTTADRGDVTAFDESVVSNLDAINKALRATLSGAIMRTAGTRRFRSRVVMQLRSKLQALAGRRAATIGAQLVAGEIDIVRRHVYLEDSLVLNVKLTIPQPFGYGLGMPTMEVHQRVIA